MYERVNTESILTHFLLILVIAIVNCLHAKNQENSMNYFLKEIKSIFGPILSKFWTNKNFKRKSVYLRWLIQNYVL